MACDFSTSEALGSFGTINERSEGNSPKTNTKSTVSLDPNIKLYVRWILEVDIHFSIEDDFLEVLRAYVLLTRGILIVF